MLSIINITNIIYYKPVLTLEDFKGKRHNIWLTPKTV